MTARLAGRSCSLAAVVADRRVHELLRDPDRDADQGRSSMSSAFQRVLVAGFLAGGTDDVDGNLETTRLLRSQLRTKSELRVIDTDVLPLMEVAADASRKHRRGRRAGCPTRDQGRQGPRAVRARLRRRRLLEEDRRGVSAAADRHRHRDVHAARSATQMHAARAGSLRLASAAAASVAERAPMSNARVRPDRPVRLHRRPHRRDAALAELHARRSCTTRTRQTPALSSYFELMDRLIPSFLSTLSSQKVKGTRIL